MSVYGEVDSTKKSETVKTFGPSSVEQPSYILDSVIFQAVVPKSSENFGQY